MGTSVLRCRNESLDQVINAAKAAKILNTPEMNEILRRFEPLVKRTAFEMTTDIALREDLANAGRMAVVKAVTRYTGPSAFPPYARIYVVGAMKREMSSWLPPCDITLVDTLEDEKDSYQICRVIEKSPVTANRTWGDLAPMIETLQDSQKAILDLHFVNGLTVEMTAAEVGTTASAVSHRMMTIYRSIAKRTGPHLSYPHGRRVVVEGKGGGVSGGASHGAGAVSRRNSCTTKFPPEDRRYREVTSRTAIGC